MGRVGTNELHVNYKTNNFKETIYLSYQIVKLN